MGEYQRSRDCYLDKDTTLKADDLTAELVNKTAWLRFGPEYVCGTKRIVYGWSGEKESNINATITKNCHNRHCMIYYTQLPLWFLVMIAFAIGKKPKETKKN